jgi:ABC-type arginine transport system permease subunit
LYGESAVIGSGLALGFIEIVVANFVDVAVARNRRALRYVATVITAVLRNFPTIRNVVTIFFQSAVVREALTFFQNHAVAVFRVETVNWFFLPISHFETLGVTVLWLLLTLCNSHVLALKFCWVHLVV